jgi:hypothetical protein
MSDILLFSVGFILFAVTTSATMWFGYQQFNRIYRQDMANDPLAPSLLVDEDNNEYRVPAGHDAPKNLDLLPDDPSSSAHLTA